MYIGKLLTQHYGFLYWIKLCLMAIIKLKSDLPPCTGQVSVGSSPSGLVFLCCSKAVDLSPLLVPFPVYGSSVLWCSRFESVLFRAQSRWTLQANQAAQ